MGETRHWEREALLKPAQCPSASHPTCPALQGPPKPGSPQHPSKAPGGHHGASGSPLEVPRASGDLASARQGFSPGQSHQPSPSGQVSRTPSTEGGAPPPDIGFPLIPRIPGWETTKTHFLWVPLPPPSSILLVSNHRFTNKLKSSTGSQAETALPARHVPSIFNKDSISSAQLPSN